MIIFVIGMIAAASIFFAVERNARAMLVLWLGVVAFVPFWVGISVPVFLPAISITGLFAVVFFYPGSNLRLGWPDFGVFAFGGLCLVAGVTGIARPGDVTMVLTQWVASYLVGRILVSQVGLSFTYRTIAVLFAAVGVCTILEFHFDWNPYFSWVVANPQYEAWGTTQLRGGVERAEWAFGHSIALGCSLALALPIIAGAQTRFAWKMAQYCVVLIGVVYTFSRAGLVTAVFGTAMLLVLYKGFGSFRLRLSLVCVSGLAAWILVPVVMGVFEADNGLATTSADYRGRLTSLIPTMKPIGVASGFYESSSGYYTFSGFKSIDSTFIFLGVSFGYLVAVLALVGVLAIAVVAIVRGTSVAGMAVASVVPALFTVAPITQFGCLVFFYIAVACMSLFDHEPSTVISGDPGATAEARFVQQRRIK